MDPPSARSWLSFRPFEPGHARSLAAEVVLVGALLGLVLGSIHGRWVAEGLLSREEYAKHLVSAVLMNWSLAESSSFLDGLRTVLLWPGQYPPLAYLGTAAAFRMLGVTEHAAFLSNLAWLFLLLVGVYLFLRPTSGRTVAALAALLTGSSSVMVATVVVYAPDMALATLTFLGLALLAEDPTLSRPGRSLAFGVALGASLLARYLALWYFLLPLAVVAGVGLWRSGWAERLRFLLGLAVLGGYTVRFLEMMRFQQALEVQAYALALALPLWFLSRRRLGSGADNRLGNLLGSLVVAWTLSVVVYAHIFPALLQLLGPDAMAPPGRTYVEEFPKYLDMGLHLVFGFPLVVLVGLLFARQCRYIPLLALSLFSAGYVVVTSPHPYIPYYGAPLVPLAVVLGTGWLPRAPSWLRVPMVAVLFPVGLAQCACTAGGFPADQGGYLAAFQRLAPHSAEVGEIQVVDGRLERLTADLAQDLEMPAGLLLAVETHDQRLSVFDKNGLQLLSLLRGYPLVWSVLYFRPTGLVPVPSLGEIGSWAIGRAEGRPVAPHGPGEAAVPRRGVVLVTRPQWLSSRLATLEVWTGQDLRIDRTWAMPFEVRAWLLRPLDSAPAPPPPQGAARAGGQGAGRASGQERSGGAGNR